MTGHKLRNRSFWKLHSRGRRLPVGGGGKAREGRGGSTITSGAQCTKAKDRADSDSGLQIWNRKRKLIKYVEQTLRVCMCVCVPLCVCVYVCVCAPRFFLRSTAFCYLFYCSFQFQLSVLPWTAFYFILISNMFFQERKCTELPVGCAPYNWVPPAPPLLLLLSRDSHH